MIVVDMEIQAWECRCSSSYGLKKVHCWLGIALNLETFVYITATCKTLGTFWIFTLCARICTNNRFWYSRVGCHSQYGSTWILRSCLQPDSSFGTFGQVPHCPCNITTIIMTYAIFQKLKSSSFWWCPSEGCQWTISCRLRELRNIHVVLPYWEFESDTAHDYTKNGCLYK